MTRKQEYIKICTDYMLYLKRLHQLFENDIDVGDQIKEIFSIYKIMLNSKQIKKSALANLSWYISSINTFDSDKILHEGERLLVRVKP